MDRRPRLTKLVTFKRLKDDAPRDDAGQVNDALPENWKTFIRRRGDCRQESSGEAYAQGQQQQNSVWSMLVRGDDETVQITQSDKVEFPDKGKFIRLNITSIKTVQDVPHWLEIVGSEA